jgi:hypothetical protein
MSYRTGKSYRRRIVKVAIPNPTAHTLQGRINSLRREIEQAQATARRFDQPVPAWVKGKQKTLASLEKQLKAVEA